MKKKKSTITILLILAILVLGVGYAAATRDLNINGTLGAKVDDSNFKVKFFSTSTQQENNATTTASSTTVTPIVTSAIVDDLNASFSVEDFTCKGDNVVFKYVVKNESADLNATVTTTDKVDFTNKEYFSVVSSFAEDSSVSETTINAGETATLYVKVACIKTPTENVTKATTNGIVTLNATVKE